MSSQEPLCLPDRPPQTQANGVELDLPLPILAGSLLRPGHRTCSVQAVCSSVLSLPLQVGFQVRLCMVILRVALTRMPCKKPKTCWILLFNACLHSQVLDFLLGIGISPLTLCTSPVVCVLLVGLRFKIICICSLESPLKTPAWELHAKITFGFLLNLPWGLLICPLTMKCLPIMLSWLPSFCGSAHLERFFWPCPKPVQWTLTPDLSVAVEFAAPADPTEQYALLWRQKEQCASAALGRDWLPAMGGRGQQTTPKRKIMSHALLKQGRGFFGFSAVHAKQFKQVRRLQFFCRWVDSRPGFGVDDCLHGIGLWNSILRASGFGSSFSSWWLTRQYVTPRDPVHVHLHCPSSDVAHQIFDAVLAEVRLLESRLQAAKQAYRQTQHEQDRHLVFREVARSPAAPVESLLHRVDAQVVCIDGCMHRCPRVCGRAWQACSAFAWRAPLDFW